ncbi:MAG: hypothetical protein ACTSYQ_02980 [Candidatus Odinarchaeia archaeon]
MKTGLAEMLFYRKHLSVKVKMKRELKDELAAELGLEKKRKGMKVEVPWWAAEILLKNGLVELTEPLIDSTYIQKKVWSERATTKLGELEKDFYIKAKYYLDELKKQNITSPNPILIRKIEEIEIPLNDLFSVRISKILKMAYRGASSSAMNKLTLEEKWLYENLRDIIKLWIKNLLGD